MSRRAASSCASAVRCAAAVAASSSRTKGRVSRPKPSSPKISSTRPTRDLLPVRVAKSSTFLPVKAGHVALPEPTVIAVSQPRSAMKALACSPCNVVASASSPSSAAAISSSTATRPKRSIVAPGMSPSSSDRPMRTGFSQLARSASTDSVWSSQKGDITPSRTHGSGRHCFPPRPLTAKATLWKGSGKVHLVRRTSSAISLTRVWAPPGGPVVDNSGSWRMKPTNGRLRA